MSSFVTKKKKLRMSMRYFESKIISFWKKILNCINYQNFKILFSVFNLRLVLEVLFFTDLLTEKH